MILMLTIMSGGESPSDFPTGLTIAPILIPLSQRWNVRSDEACRLAVVC